jgi:NAD+ kinase
VLGAVRRARQERCPVLGFNLGTIGFLAEAEPHELEAVLEALANKRFSVHPRLTLRATLPDGRQEVGVNDVVVEKIESQRLVALDVDVGGAPFFTYRADGLVIATPTGSTAYSFSAGGPLVDPGLEAIVMTPVAPHSLFGRSLVVPADQVIRCRVVAERPVRVSVDGREVAHLGYGDWVEVGRGEERVGFIELHDEPFPSVVSRKFRLR